MIDLSLVTQKLRGQNFFTHPHPYLLDYHKEAALKIKSVKASKKIKLLENSRSILTWNHQSKLLQIKVRKAFNAILFKKKMAEHLMTTLYKIMEVRANKCLRYSHLMKKLKLKIRNIRLIWSR